MLENETEKSSRAVFLSKAAVSSRPPDLEKSIFSVFRKGDGKPTSAVRRVKEYRFNQASLLRCAAALSSLMRWGLSLLCGCLRQSPSD